MYNLISMVWVAAIEGIIHSKLKSRLGGQMAGIIFYTSTTRWKEKCETVRFPCSESLEYRWKNPFSDHGRI